MNRARPRRLVAAAAVFAVLVLGWSLTRGASGETTRPPAHAREGGAKPVLEPTKRDAVRTASSFLSAMTLETLLDARRRQSVVAVYAEPSARPALEQLYEREQARVATSYRRPPRVARAALLGYRLDGFSQRAATVSVWAASIGGSGSYAPTAGWSTIIVDLAWTESGWRITGVDENPGPSGEWPIKSLASEARTFRPFRYAP